MAVKRHQIVEAVKARLTEIRVGAEYNTDLGLYVFESKAKGLPSERTYEVSVSDPNQTFQGEDTVYHYWDLRLEIKIQCRDSLSTNETKRKLIADIYKAIGRDDEFGGLTNGCTPVDDENDVMQEGDKVADIMVTLTVHYRVQKWQNQ